MMMMMMTALWTPWRTFLHGKQTISPYTTNVDTLSPIPYIFHEFKKGNALGNNNSHFSPVKHLLTFSALSLGWIVRVIPQCCKTDNDNIVDQMTSTTERIPLENDVERLPHICNTIGDNGKKGNIQTKYLQLFLSQASNLCAHKPKKGQSTALSGYVTFLEM